MKPNPSNPPCRFAARSAPRSLGWLILPLALPGAVLATTNLVREPHPAPTRQEELKAPEDPTILLRRAWLETEWNKFEDGRHNLEETLGGLWSWRVAPRWEWAVRFKQPYEWRLAGDDPDDRNNNGWGDFQLATGTAYALSERLRVGGGLDLRMPTAQDDLGDSVWRLQEIFALGWDATDWLTFSPSMEYNQSLAEVNSAPSQHYLEAYFPLTFVLPRGWAIAPQYEFKVDFEDGNNFVNTAKLRVAKQFETPPLGLALSVKRSFDGGPKDFTVNFALTWFFR